MELLQTRHEKDVLRQNRIAYERQLEIRRRQDFIEAMDREAVKFLKKINENKNDIEGEGI